MQPSCGFCFLRAPLRPDLGLDACLLYLPPLALEVSRAQLDPVRVQSDEEDLYVGGHAEAKPSVLLVYNRLPAEEPLYR